jgi:simple sugar transport system permease protein
MKLSNQKIKELLKNIQGKITAPIVSVLLALLVSAGIISIMGVDPLTAYYWMFKGALGSNNSIAETLLKATPLILTGLSFALAMRCGLLNIGAEGQLFMGGLAATIAGIYLTGMPMVIHLPIAIMAGFVGGGLWGLVAGLLKVRFGANEIITTVMLNYVAIFFVGYMVHGPLLEPPGFLPQTPMVAASAMFPKILAGTRLHAGLLIALIALLLFYILLWKTKLGYEIRVVGSNQDAAKYAGMNPKKSILLAMFFSGGLAGLAGMSEILGVQLRLMEKFSQGLGFDGIAIALLGQNGPIGVLLASLLFGAMRSGANIMQLVTGVPVAIIYVIQALVVLFVVCSVIFRRKGLKPIKDVLTKFKRKKGAGIGGG